MKTLLVLVIARSTASSALAIAETWKAEDWAPPRTRLAFASAPWSWAGGARATLAAAARPCEAMLILTDGPGWAGLEIAEGAANAASHEKDGCGLTWPGPVLAPGGPEILDSTLPAELLAQAAAQSGGGAAAWPAEAGDDVANRCFFALLSRQSGPPAALVRAPLSLETARARGLGPALLNRAQILAGAKAAARAAADFVERLPAPPFPLPAPRSA